jgi:hypothetical protein
MHVLSRSDGAAGVMSRVIVNRRDDSLLTAQQAKLTEVR